MDKRACTQDFGTYLLHQCSVQAQMSLNMSLDSLEPSLIANMRYGNRVRFRSNIRPTLAMLKTSDLLRICDK